MLADEATQTRRIWIKNLATGDQRPVPGTESANHPFWSPDGRSLGYRSVEDAQLKRVDLDGGRPVPLAKAVRRAAPPGAATTSSAAPRRGPAAARLPLRRPGTPSR